MLRGGQQRGAGGPLPLSGGSWHRTEPCCCRTPRPSRGPVRAPPRPGRRWEELAAFMAGLGYAGALQEKNAAGGGENVLAVFYRAARLRLAWVEERSRVLLVELEWLPGAAGGGGGGLDAGAAAAAQPAQPPAANGHAPEGPAAAAAAAAAAEEDAAGAAAEAGAAAAGAAAAGAPLEAEPHANGHGHGEGRGHAASIFVVNVHLEAHPYRGSDRVNQLKHALHRLELHQQGRGLAPEATAVVIAGDFNSLSMDAPCTLLRRGRLDAFATEAHLPQVGLPGAC